HSCSFTPSIDSTSGVVSWTCPAAVETCSVPVTVTDDGTPNRADTKALTIECTNEAPVITSTAPGTATESQPYTYSITCADDDGDSRTLTRGPNDTCGGAVTNGSGGTGTYSFVPPE